MEIKQIDKLMSFIKKDINILKGNVFERVVKEIMIDENEKNNFMFFLTALVAGGINEIMK